MNTSIYCPFPQPRSQKIPLIEIEPRRPVQVPKEELYAEALSVIPGIERLGAIFKSSKAVELTEPETEFRISCIKHVYANHLVLQFECLNTLNDQLLERVLIRLTAPPGYAILDEIACERLPYDRPGYAYCMLEFPPNALDAPGTFGATLEFTVRDCDPNTGIPESGEGYADTYPLEEFEMGVGEQLRKSGSEEGNWDHWASAPEVSDTFVLPQTDALEAAKAVCEHLGLPKVFIGKEGDGAVIEIRASGLHRRGAPVVVKGRLAAAGGGVTMQLAVRSPAEDVAQMVVAAVG